MISLDRCSNNAMGPAAYANGPLTGGAGAMRLSSIVCTLGPASRDVAVLQKMLASGMNIARLNLSHGTHEYHAETIRALRLAADKFGQRTGAPCPVAIAIDTKGSEIRTGLLEGGGSAEVRLAQGDLVRVTTDPKYYARGSKSLIYIDYEDLARVVRPGDRLFIDDGLLCLRCVGAEGGFLVCEVQNGGALGSCKGVNVPGAVAAAVAAVSERDRRDLRFGAEQGVDLVFASFTRSATEVRLVRAALGAGSRIKVIAKIEDQRGVDRMDEIIEAADGVLIDRGDLGVEIGVQRVFLVQKEIVAKCNRAGKPIVVATHFLESMVDRPRPTRAESSDVANAVLDGADCVMLSGETAKGLFPVECVATMARICREAEAAVRRGRRLQDAAEEAADAANTVAVSAVASSLNCGAAAIIVVTKSGQSAQLIAKYRPKCPIVAVTRNSQVARQLQLFRAVMPVYYAAEISGDWHVNVETRVRAGIAFGKARGFIQTNDTVLIVTGWKQGSGYTNTLSLINVN